MIPIQDSKFVSVTPPAAIVDNASVTCAAVDTAGFGYATIVVQLGATDIALTALKLTESDDDSSYSDVSGATYAGSLPSATDDNKFYVFFVNTGTGNRKRYLKPVITVGDGTAGGYVTVNAILTRAGVAPTTVAQRGIAGQVFA